MKYKIICLLDSGYQPRSSSRYRITYLPDLGIVNTWARSMSLPGQVSEILIPKHTLLAGYYFRQTSNTLPIYPKWDN
jgi:hypothetical protein